MRRFAAFAELDRRSLGCLRIGTATVLAWDMLRAQSVAADWWAMQAYHEPKLPTWLIFGSEAMTLRLAASAVLIVAVLLALGWRTRQVTLIAWVSAGAFQFAASGTADYHNAVLCVLLFWCLALPTGAVLSLDARAGRRPQLPGWLTVAAGAGLLLSLAWIYLCTAVVKSGPAWWQEGSAVWLALLDRGTPTAPGRWLALAAPAGIWPTITHAALLFEYVAPVLILWPRCRVYAALGLALFHLGMWPVLALGSFPLLMMVAASTLIPGSTWDRLGWRQQNETARVSTPRRVVAERVVAGLMALGLLITAEGERVVAWEGDTVWPYAGAGHVARLRYLLGMEIIWGMYAPEPFHAAGWWVAVGWHADGTVVDPITGEPPTLRPPAPSGPGSRLRWLAFSDAPYLDDDWGIQHIYRNFLLERRNGRGADQLHRLALVWVHEPLTPFESPVLRQPALVLTWPQGQVSAAAVEEVLETSLHVPVFDDESGPLTGVRALSLSPSEQWLP
ncbi:MAG TPA: HTTM domain-containing protein [Candidatus Latescibacteria bacterium]|jgi:hypothetical protein|nr:hypothetical protein [Gemmatimonadaceae bacterium]MDP6015856.1 HTTM domain-containing protein [Candidatus Latescibacterota bacterium]HJP29169.1 HTTM domain-containing protein [Candidatus Latescibacterota bacterium]